MNTFEYIIQDEVGLHARPASQLVEFLKTIDSKVTITKGEKTVDAKRMFALMGLAIKEGETVVFSLEGDTAPEDSAKLEQFCKDTF